MGKLLILWYLLSLIFYILAHGTPAAASLTGPHTGCCGFKAVVLLSPISFASVAWESSCEHPQLCTVVAWENFLRHWKKTCRTGNLLPFLYWCLLASSFLSSGRETDLQPYSPGSGWFGVLSGIVGLIFLGSWLMFLMWSLTMWWCWETINVLLSELQVELVVLINAQKRQIFQALSWLLCIRCTVLGMFETP